jgi:KEOPS complex subunit Cgi121
LVFTGSLESKLNPSDIGSILSQITTAKYDLLASQLFDNRGIWGYKHLYSSAWHAMKAKKNERMISKSLSIEILLYVAGQRQIKKAINLLGVKDTTEAVTGVLLGETPHPLISINSQLIKDLNLKSDLSLLEDFSSKKQHFLKRLINDGFAANEFTFLDIEKAVLQKIALLALE